MATDQSGLWPFIVLILCLRRRRWFVIALGLWSSTASAHVPETRPGGEVAVIGYDTSRRHHAHVGEARIIARGYARGILSPDGKRVLLVHRDLRHLSVLELAAGASPKRIASGQGIGRNPKWYPNSRGIAYHSPEQSSHAQPMLGVSLKGRSELPMVGRRTQHFKIENHRILLDAAVISPGDDRFFYLRIASDESYVAFWGLSSGVWLYRVKDGQLWALSRWSSSHAQCSGPGDRTNSGTRRLAYRR